MSFYLPSFLKDLPFGFTILPLFCSINDIIIIMIIIIMKQIVKPSTSLNRLRF